MTLVGAVLERVGFRRPQYESVKKVIDDQGFITDTTLTLDRNLYPAPEVSFTGCLNALPKAASAEAEKLLLYLNQCEQGNTYDASLACYEYLGEKPRGCVTAAYHDEMLAFEIGAPTGLQPSDKVSAALEILQQFCRERSQKPFPARLPRAIEAVALAVSRHLCVRGEAQTAHDLIQALAPLAPDQSISAPSNRLWASC